MTERDPDAPGTPGVREQVARGAGTFEEAARRHRWQVPRHYNIARDIVDRWALDPERSGRPALAVLDGTGGLHATTWRKLREHSLRLGHALRTRYRVERGDVVAIVLGQGVPAAVSQVAAFRIGAIACPISRLYAGDGLAWRLRHSGAKILITDSMGLASLGDTRDGLPELREVLLVDAGDSEEHDFWQIVHGSPAAAETAETRSDDPALLIYTSGTTGDPKGVLHGHRVALGHANVSYLLNDIRDDDVFWSPNDWSWIAGVGNGLLAPWGFGLTILSMGDGRFDAASVGAFLDRHQPTVSFLPPSALRLLKQAGVTPRRPLRAVVTGGEPLSDELKNWCTTHLCAAINIGFGQTEGNDLIGAVSAWEEPSAESIGRLLPGHEAALLDENGDAVPDGAEGELCLRVEDRPVFMLEYYRNPEETGRKLKNGWLHTGDRALRDERGYFQFVGRGDDVIKSSGYRIGPTEIENVIAAHPAVLECAVVGLPDEDRGQVVTAVVRLIEGVDAPAVCAELADLARGSVGRHAYPRRFEVIERFPKTVTGKIQRAAIRKLFT